MPNQTSSKLNEYRLSKYTPRTVIQHDEMDCGAAILASLLNSYGVKVNLWDCKILLPSSSNGVSISDLYEAIDKLGFIVDIFSIDSLQALQSIDEPMITLLMKGNSPDGGENHFVISKLTSSNKETFTLTDPSWGTLKVKSDQLFSIIHKNILVISPPPSGVVNISIRKFHFGEILKLISLKHKPLFLMTLFAIVTALMSVLPPIIFGTLVDSFSSSLSIKSYDKSYLFVLMISFSLVFQDLISFISNTMSNIISSQLEYKFMRTIMNRVFSIDIQNFVSRRTSDYYSFFANAQSLLAWITNTYSEIVLHVFSVIFILISISIRSTELLLVTVFFSLAVAFISFQIAKKKKEQIYSYNMLHGRGSSQFADILSHFKMIKSFKAEKLFLNKWFLNVVRSVSLSFKLTKISLNYTLLIQLIKSTSSAAILFIGVQKVMSSDITIGELMAIWALSNTLLSFVVSTESYFSSTIKAKVGFDRLLSLIVETEHFDMLRANTVVYNPDKKTSEMVHLSDVSFNYHAGGKKFTITNLNFTLPRKVVLGVAGGSGAGKSTFLGLLSGQFRPTKGIIRLGLDQSSILMVDQDIKLFNGSLRENLLIKGQRNDESKLQDLITRFGLRRAIDNAPLGLETHINDINRNLSGGEVQRLLIVRSLMHDPELLILDEPTSSVDADTEREILKVILDWIRDNNKTLIFASHRQSMFESSDHIITFKGGELVEQGQFHDLVAQDSEFSRLFKRGQHAKSV